jgi:hypothetical protein
MIQACRLSLKNAGIDYYLKDVWEIRFRESDITTKSAL